LAQSDLQQGKKWFNISPFSSSDDSPLPHTTHAKIPSSWVVPLGGSLPSLSSARAGVDEAESSARRAERVAGRPSWDGGGLGIDRAGGASFGTELGKESNASLSKQQSFCLIQTLPRAELWQASDHLPMDFGGVAPILIREFVPVKSPITHVEAPI
jgi:hypothetical protein